MFLNHRKLSFYFSPKDSDSMFKIAQGWLSEYIVFLEVTVIIYYKLKTPGKSVFYYYLNHAMFFSFYIILIALISYKNQNYQIISVKLFSYFICTVTKNLSVQFSRLVVSKSLRPHELQHARPPCPSPTLGVHSNSR